MGRMFGAWSAYCDQHAQNTGHDVSVELLWQFPRVTFHFEACEQLRVSWLEVHHGTHASSSIGSIEFCPRLYQLIVSVLLVHHASLRPVCGHDCRFGSRETAWTNVQSRHATTRSGDQMKCKG